MRIPLFPLHAVSFPGAEVSLVVFEPRYRAMMEDVLAGERRFALGCIRRGMEVGGYAEVHPVAVLASVEQVQRSADGRMSLVARAGERLRIVERLPDDPYPQIEASVIAERAGEDAAHALADARTALRRYLSVLARLRGAELPAPSVPDDPIAASFTIADVLEIDLPERQRLLEEEDAAGRLRLAVRLARREALLLDAVGPSVTPPRTPTSLN